jgi:hypothetical protein
MNTFALFVPMLAPAIFVAAALAQTPAPATGRAETRRPRAGRRRPRSGGRRSRVESRMTIRPGGR